MCGINGFNWDDRNLIKEMNKTIIYRGPDDEGIFLDKRISLGHRRLSILDLSKKGKQPMKFNNLMITFNGEIYNFQEIRNELEEKGHRFKSNTDTEIILHSYDEWGKDCISKFNGMWAFCIYDSKNEELFLSRDRFGVKPLYYYFDGKRFIFSSELKAIIKHPIKKEINKKALNYYFYQKYIGDDLTIYKDCFKLKAGHYCIFDLKMKKLSIIKYYFLDNEIAKNTKIPIKERLEIIEEILIDSVNKRLISDVPVGSFLSGGLDSSLISAIISKRHKNFKTFSIGFKEESFDEVPYSERISNYIKTTHNYKYMNIDDNTIKYVLSNLDEPFGDSSLLPSFLLSKITRENVTVALSGDGGDEVFGGYDSYKGYYIAKYIPNFAINFLRIIANNLPNDNKKLSLSFKIKRFVRNYNSDVIKRHLDWMATFDDESRNKLLNKNFTGNLISTGNTQDLLGIQSNDINNYMCEDILKKVDLSSMLNSLEVRNPFLDYRLVPLVLSLPEKYKIQFFETKWLLKKIGIKYLPKEIVYRQKRGFSVPIAIWIKKSKLIQDYLTKNIYYNHNFINFDYVQDLYREHINKINDNSRELWLIFVFNFWWNNEK